MSNVQGNQREADLAYLAGLVDGEGCISIKHNKSNNVFFPWVAVGMTQLEGLELLVEMFGGKIREDRTSNRKSVMYRWEQNKRDVVVHVLSSLLPYLRVKKALAILVLAFCSDGEPVKVGGRSRTSVKEQERRKDLHSKVKELNHVRAPATTNRTDIREDEVIV